MQNVFQLLHMAYLHKMLFGEKNMLVNIFRNLNLIRLSLTVNLKVFSTKYKNNIYLVTCLHL